MVFISPSNHYLLATLLPLSPIWRSMWLDNHQNPLNNHKWWFWRLFGEPLEHPSWNFHHTVNLYTDSNTSALGMLCSPNGIHRFQYKCPNGMKWHHSQLVAICMQVLNNSRCMPPISWPLISRFHNISERFITCTALFALLSHARHHSILLISAHPAASGSK